MNNEMTAIPTIAGFMALAARTAPKGKGVDTILIRVLDKKETSALSTRLAELGEKRGIGFFKRGAKNLLKKRNLRSDWCPGGCHYRNQLWGMRVCNLCRDDRGKEKTNGHNDNDSVFRPQLCDSHDRSRDSSWVLQ
jgi:uncharacterized ferredoxin-like protein